ncbi:MAG: KOW motif-containing protein [bacterium]
MAISRIQKGDKVKVISGKYKGISGVITGVFKKEYYGGVIKKRVTVSEIPRIVKFKKAVNYNGQKFPGSQTMVERKIDSSNVSLVTDKGEISKSKVEIQGDKKVRVLKKNSEIVVKSKPETEKLDTKEDKKTKTK